MPDRRELEQRISAFVAGYVDGAYERFGDDFDVGAFAIVMEVNVPADRTDGAQGGASEIGGRAPTPATGSRRGCSAARSCSRSRAVAGPGG